MYTHQQEATCGLQVCQHPLCWATNRQAARGLLHLHSDDFIHQNPQEKTSEQIIGTQHSGSWHSVNGQNVDEDDDDILEGLPTVTILNMLDEYGFDGNDQYPSPSSLSIDDQPGGDYKPRKSVNIHADAKRVPRLALKSLTTSQSAEDVTAPANTPLQSSHGFGDYHHGYRSPLDHSKYDSPTDTNNLVRGGKRGTQKTGYKKVQLEIDDANAAGLKPKRMLIWCPTRSKRAKHIFPSERKPKGLPAVKAITLPLHSVPEYRASPTSHKAIKSTMPKKTQHSFVTARKMRAVKDAAHVRQPRGPSGATPQEISQLRKVPVDILIRVLQQAEENGIINKTQTKFLLAQVVGKKDKLPAIHDTPRNIIHKSAENVTEEIVPKTPLETKNIKILNAEEARGLSPRTVSVEPVFRMDTASSIQKKPASSQKQKRHVPHTTKATDFNVVQRPYVPSIDIPPPENSLVETDRSGEAQDKEDSQYGEKLRDLAEENLRSIGALPREIPSPKKTPVKYVATLFDQTVPPSPPIKPFHYPKSPRDLFLGPIPSPPPPTPPTERDSMYDPQVGGSTMMVNPSMTGPSTITSFIDKRSSSPSESKTPTTAREVDCRQVKTTQTSINGSQKRGQISSPFGSSIGLDGWPQINEEDFLRTAGSSELAGSPMPSFAEEDMRIVSRNESTGSPREETPLSDKFQNIQQVEIHSPAPPPPSPEPIAPVERQSTTETTPASPRAGGAATALGLVILAKNSTNTSPETEAGATPTPVVSSVRSDVETPLGRVTRAQTIGSTPAIPETPYERDSEDSGSVTNKRTEDKNAESPTEIEARADAPVEAISDFETNVSPEVAKEELEKEMDELDIG